MRIFHLLGIAGIVLSAGSPGIAQDTNWWDADTTDAFRWEKRVELTLVNPEALARTHEPVEIPFDHLPWPVDAVSDSLRVVDPQAKPDGPHETGGSDLPFQIDRIDGKPVLLFQVDFPEKAERKPIHLYASPGKRAPAAQYASALKCAEGEQGVTMGNGIVSLDVASSITGVSFRDRRPIDYCYWYLPAALPDGTAVRNQDAKVTARQVIGDGPVRRRLHMETMCDAEGAPDAVRFELDIDIFAGRSDFRMATTFWLRSQRIRLANLITGIFPDGPFQAGRTRYACEVQDGKVIERPFSTEKKQIESRKDALDCAMAYDPTDTSGGVAVVAGEWFRGFSFAAHNRRIYTQYDLPPVYQDDTPRWAETWIGFVEPGGEQLKQFAHTRRNPLRVIYQGHEIAPAPKQRVTIRKGLDVDLTRFTVCVRSGTEPRSVEAWNHRGKSWHALKRRGPGLYDAPRSGALLDDRGEARLRIDPPPQGVYLLGTYPEGKGDYNSLPWLRANSLAYAEGDFKRGQEIRVSHRSHDVVLRSTNGRGMVTMDGEELLAEPYALRIRGKRASFDEPAKVFRDPWGNPIRVEAQAAGDRVRFDITYSIDHPQDTWSDVRFVFKPRSRIERFETLRWESGADGFIQEPVRDEHMLVFCQNPFILARSADGSCLGFLDPDQSNIIFRTTADAVSVEYWAWPREKGKTYQWSFELVPCHGHYANALLRALDPHTAKFTERIHGCCAYGWGTRRATEAAAAGVRAIYYHGWFHRNGKYFDPSLSLDDEYETVSGRKTSYRAYYDDIRRAHEAGIKVCMYTQFTGISEPTVREFESSMVRDLEGRLITVGEDGLFDNIWANPDPDLPYGRSFIEQVDGMIQTLGCDGIGMDRTDRLDNRHGKGLFDLAHFDGSASPFLHGGEHRPCSSMAIQGRRFWEALRRTLDKHGALWIANVPRGMVIFRLADAVKADIHHAPWTLFFLRAMGNGKTFFVHSRPYEGAWSEGSDLLGRLVQAYSVIEVGREGPIHSVRVPRENTRLLYIIPSEDPYPRYWIFARGGTRLEYNPTAGPGTGARYAESSAVPIGEQEK